MSSTDAQDSTMNGFSLTTNGRGEIYNWSEVSRIHKVRNGIYQKNGVLISLLTDFGKLNQCYPDFHGDSQNTIYYTGAGRRGDQQLDSFNRAMFNAVESAHSVPLFVKLAVGNWQWLGFWRVAEGAYIFDEDQRRMVWKFTLLKDEKALLINIFPD